MTTEEAIKRLDQMQDQILHGSRIFGDIADVIRRLENVRRAALYQVGIAIEKAEVVPIASVASLSAAHRILATGRSEGALAGEGENRCSADEKAEP